MSQLESKHIMPSKTKPVKPKVVDMLNNPVSRAVSEKLLEAMSQLESEHSMPSKSKPVKPKVVDMSKPSKSKPEVIDMSRPSPPLEKPIPQISPSSVPDSTSTMQHREQTSPTDPVVSRSKQAPKINDEEHVELQMIDTESAMTIDSVATDVNMKSVTPAASPSPDISDEEVAESSLPLPKMNTTVVNPLRKRLTPLSEKNTPEKRIPNMITMRSRESQIASYISKFNIGDGCDVLLNQGWRKGTVTVIDPTFVEIKVFGESKITRVTLKDIKKRLRLSSKYKGLLWDREANRFRAFIELKIPAKETVEVELLNAQTQEEMAALLRQEAYKFFNQGRLSEGDASGYGVLKIESSQIPHVS